MIPFILEAAFAWWSFCGTLFIAYPSKPVAQVCVVEVGVPEYCWTPKETLEVLPVNGWVESVTITLADGTVEGLSAGPISTDGLDHRKACRK